MKFYILILISLSFQNSHAWGKRGHEMIGSLAAQLLAEKHPDGEFLKRHSFDMGYYNNVPDIYWRSNWNKIEEVEHFIDLEIFTNQANKQKVKLEWEHDRKKFFKRLKVKKKAGRAPWRIHEINEKLKKITKKLQAKKLKKKKRQELQLKWLSTAGTMGHYIADLAQPLHTSENYDGQLTKQKGIHSWFETRSIDQLHPNLKKEVYKRALSKWKRFHKNKANMSPFDLSLDLAKNSHEQLGRLLKLDQRQGRKDLASVAPKYKELIVERLSLGILYLAQTWSLQLGWEYNGKHFYGFKTQPHYIFPGKQ